MTTQTRNRWAGIISIAAWSAAACLFAAGWYRARSQSDDLERRLADADAREQAILALRTSADHGYAVLDREGRVREWNPALERWTGYNEAELLGKELLPLMAEHNRLPHDRGYKAIINDPASRGRTFMIECELIPKTADAAPLRVQVAARVVRPDIPGAEPYAVALIDRSRKVMELKRGIARPK